MKKGKLIGLLGILAAGALALSACGSSSKSAAKNKFRTLDEIKRVQRRKRWSFLKE